MADNPVLHQRTEDFLAVLRNWPTKELEVGRIVDQLKELTLIEVCLLYTSDAADDMQCVDLGGRRIIKKV